MIIAAPRVQFIIKGARSLRKRGDCRTDGKGGNKKGSIIKKQSSLRYAPLSTNPMWRQRCHLRGSLKRRDHGDFKVMFINIFCSISKNSPSSPYSYLRHRWACGPFKGEMWQPAGSAREGIVQFNAAAAAQRGTREKRRGRKLKDGSWNIQAKRRRREWRRRRVTFRFGRLKQTPQGVNRRMIQFDFVIQNIS